jgi:hypothetical protein
MIKLRDERGVIIIGAIIITVFFMTVALALAEFGANHYISTRRTVINNGALNAADAGADAFMYQINNASTYQGTTNAPSAATNSCSGYTITPTVLINNTVQGKVTYESCVQNGAIAGEKIVNVTGKVYLPSTSATPISTRKLRLVISGTAAAAGYTVQTGNGGLIMSNTSAVGAGDFYINGRLQMSNSASIGDASLTKASRVWVSGSGCGSGASYPQICSGATGQADLPIYISNPAAHIYADVHSPNMTGGGSDGSSTRTRITDGGLIDGIAPVVPLPDNNRSTVMARNTWVSKPASAGNCPGNGGAITWAAGTHFTGNVSVDHGCIVTVAGDIWIDGSLQLSNNDTALKVAEGVGTAPNILIDGLAGFKGNNSSALIKNTAGTALQVRTFWSAAGACPTVAPSVCPTPTGSNLLTSSNTVTIESSNSFVASGATFYAVWSQVRINNGTDVGQLIGQKINLANSGTITFSGAVVTGSAAGNWNVKYYEQTF